ncbi:MAG: DUF512 domain-containing protein [Candidatus Eisenbacteria bacterium]|nr:DUF512 domain-containing protein [Candidatus Eisenbacteria bacterium]
MESASGPDGGVTGRNRARFGARRGRGDPGRKRRRERMRIVHVEERSAARKAGFRAGDSLVRIGDVAVSDSLDVAYALGSSDAEETTFTIERSGGIFTRELPAAHPGSLGFTLEEDRYRSCSNRCVFCFVDQLPPGLRAGLSFKDEDYRLSFAFGNYITLTNLSEADYGRIARQRLSPLYVSVHASDDDVRRKLLGNPGAPPIMESLQRLADSGIELHTQIVVVPGMNDGDVLSKTLDDVAAMRAVSSVAVVPVGLTAHREGLTPLEPVDAALASSIIEEVEGRQEGLLRERGSRVVFASDELYRGAGRTCPPAEAYEDFPQLENGVGLIRSFEREFAARTPALERCLAELGDRAPERLTVTIATGSSAAPFLSRLVVPALARAGPIEAKVLEVENNLFGPTVTVAGLLAGRDMASALAAGERTDLALLPAEALNADGVTLDGMTVDDVAALAGANCVRASRDVIDALIEHVASPADGARPEGGTPR